MYWESLFCRFGVRAVVLLTRRGTAVLGKLKLTMLDGWIRPSLLSMLAIGSSISGNLVLVGRWGGGGLLIKACPIARSSPATTARAMSWSSCCRNAARACASGSAISS